MKILIGNSGLVGKTIKEKMFFDFEYNSKNIDTYSPPDNCDLYLSCLPSTKWLVNQNTKKDLDNIFDILNKINKFTYKNIVLISTIDVYSNSPKGFNEKNEIIFNEFTYGSNRFLFEKMVKQYLKYENLKIFRLPALFNKHIKKNILYDLLNNHNVNQININSSYQWYNLDNLVDDIKKYSIFFNEYEIFNLFTEPIDSEELIKLFPQHMGSVLKLDNRIDYDYKTIHTTTGYIKTKLEVINEIKNLINEFISE